MLRDISKRRKVANKATVARKVHVKSLATTGAEPGVPLLPRHLHLERRRERVALQPGQVLVLALRVRTRHAHGAVEGRGVVPFLSRFTSMYLFW